MNLIELFLSIIYYSRSQKLWYIFFRNKFESDLGKFRKQARFQNGNRSGIEAIRKRGDGEEEYRIELEKSSKIEIDIPASWKSKTFDEKRVWYRGITYADKERNDEQRERVWQKV